MDITPEEISEWHTLIDSIPDPVRKLFFLKCAACGHRTWNCHGAEYLGYQAHYLEKHWEKG